MSRVTSNLLLPWGEGGSEKLKNINDNKKKTYIQLYILINPWEGGADGEELTS